jgi:DNA polymerase III subunit epsilon
MQVEIGNITNNPQPCTNHLSSLPDSRGRYIVLDTETTGLDIRSDHLISISAIEILDGKITGSQFNAYVRTREEKKIIEGKEPKNKNKYYYIEEYSKEIFEIERHTLLSFLRFIGDSIIFAHNALFDFKFIDAELIKWGLSTIPIEKYRCTLQIARKFLTNQEKFNLGELCRYFDFKCEKKDFHHGPFDAFMCGRILLKLFELNEGKVKQKEFNLIQANINKDYDLINVTELKDENINNCMENTIYFDKKDLESERDNTQYNNDINQLANHLQKLEINNNKQEDCLLEEIKEVVQEKILTPLINLDSNLKIFENFEDEIKIEADLKQVEQQQPKNRMKNMMKNYYIDSLNKPSNNNARTINIKHK